jgi:hypothetical protein
MVQRPQCRLEADARPALSSPMLIELACTHSPSGAQKQASKKGHGYHAARACYELARLRVQYPDAFPTFVAQAGMLSA